MDSSLNLLAKGNEPENLENIGARWSAIKLIKSRFQYLMEADNDNMGPTTN